VVVGDRAPSFELPDTSGDLHALPVEPAPPATVVVQTCNHCPYVIAWNPRLRRVAEDYESRGVRFLAVNSNDASRYPADSIDHMKRFVSDQSWPIPYLYDESQEAARALGAIATPHVFVFDGDHRLAYQGAPDANHQDDSLDADWLRGAIDAVLDGRTPDPQETPPRGCSVKWRS
jgi:peroxiredoxin